MDISWKKSWIPLFFLFLLVESMLSASFFMNNSEILFPEASALAMGCWVFKEERWNNNYWYICIMPTLSASVAIGLSVLPVSIAVRESTALVVVVLILHTFKSSIGPAISAALLPLVLGIHTWDYVLAVFILTFVVMLGAKKNKNRLNHLLPMKKQSVRKTFYSLITLLLVSICYILKLKIGIIPPLLVVTYEWFNKNELTRLFLIRQILLLTLAAIIGSGFHLIFPKLNIVAGLISVSFTLLFMKILKAKLPPALAISLLPLIIGDFPVWKFSLTVLIESLILSEIVIWYLRLEPKFSLPLQLFKQVHSK